MRYFYPPEIYAELETLPAPTESDYIARLQDVSIEVVVIARRQAVDRKLRDQIDTILIDRSASRIRKAVERHSDLPPEEFDEAEAEAMALFWEKVQEEYPIFAFWSFRCPANAFAFARARVFCQRLWWKRWLFASVSWAGPSCSPGRFPSRHHLRWPQPLRARRPFAGARHPLCHLPGAQMAATGCPSPKQPEKRPARLRPHRFGPGPPLANLACCVRWRGSRQARPVWPRPFALQTLQRHAPASTSLRPPDRRCGR